MRYLPPSVLFFVVPSHTVSVAYLSLPVVFFLPQDLLVIFSPSQAASVSLSPLPGLVQQSKYIIQTVFTVRELQNINICYEYKVELNGSNTFGTMKICSR